MFLKVELLFILMLCQQVNAQTGRITEFADRMYGPDQLLYNGKIYTNFHTQYRGHKFLGDDKYVNGRITIDGIEFKDQLLKYDIYNQKIILLVEFDDQSKKEIILNDTKLEAFSMEDKSFKILPDYNGMLRIYQVFEGTSYSILYFWKKEVIPYVSGSHSLAEFEDARNQKFVRSASGFSQFSNNRSFSRIFPEYQTEIIHFLRNNKIRMNHADDSEINSVNNYINSLATQNASVE